jgi:hypothetical protein
MPEEPTVRDWALDNKEGFFARYARARKIQAYAVADELLEIADDGRNDWMESNGGYELNGECVQRSRLRLDIRKWHLSKILPNIARKTIRGPQSGWIRRPIGERATGSARSAHP